MINTLENKAKFSACYWGQMVMREEMDSHKYFCKPSNEADFELNYLELTPLSQISDEDACNLARFCGYANANEIIGYRIIAGLDLLGYFPTGLPIATKVTGHYEAIDYLRSRGYALPWMGLSVEKLVEYGWVKLQGGNNG